MRNRQEWRQGTLTRAETIADDVRLLEFAVEGALPRFDPGSHSSFKVARHAVIQDKRNRESYKPILLVKIQAGTKVRLEII